MLLILDSHKTQTSNLEVINKTRQQHVDIVSASTLEPQASAIRRLTCEAIEAHFIHQRKSTKGCLTILEELSLLNSCRYCFVMHGVTEAYFAMAGIFAIF